MVDTNEFTKPLHGEVRGGVIRRRRWSAAEKGGIVAEAVAPGAVIAEVARRHDLTPQHLSNWVRAAKDGHFALPEMAFVPVVAQGPRRQCRNAERRPAIEIEADGIVVRLASGEAGLVREILGALRGR